MTIDEHLASVRKLSDDALLSGLNGLLRSSRRLVAEVIAHLGEVEERRLHLLAGYGSMFAYCVTGLGMSEDEACRRIEVARLARRVPSLLERLAAGHVSLSVAALLKPHLSATQHAPLLDAVSGKTVQQARELLACWFPQPDVPSAIRKLPEPCTAAAGPTAVVPAVVEPPSVHAASPQGDLPLRAVEPAPSNGDKPGSAAPAAAPSADVHRHAATPPPAPRALPASRSIEPLSAGRYKIVFTADAELKHKLELARDLSRHALPHGDLAALVGRALDVLLEQLMKRRFAAPARAKGNPSPAPHASEPSVEKNALDRPAPNARAAGKAAPSDTAPSDTAPSDTAPSDTAPSDTAPSDTAPSDTAPSDTAPSDTAPSDTVPPLRRQLPSEVRRSVLSRDEMRCTWRGPDGRRCDSRAWLEHDHITPFGLGGDHHPANIRHLCRAHNRLAAELAYGKDTITRIIHQRRARDRVAVSRNHSSATGQAPLGPP